MKYLGFSFRPSEKRKILKEPFLPKDKERARDFGSSVTTVVWASDFISGLEWTCLMITAYLDYNSINGSNTKSLQHIHPAPPPSPPHQG